MRGRAKRAEKTDLSGITLCLFLASETKKSHLEILDNVADNKHIHLYLIKYLSYDVASGSEITPCNKIDKTLVVYRFTGNVMASITTLRT